MPTTHRPQDELCHYKPRNFRLWSDKSKQSDKPNTQTHDGYPNKDSIIRVSDGVWVLATQSYLQTIPDMRKCLILIRKL